MDILLAEHRVTEEALNCLEQMAERWSAPGGREELDWPAIREAINFFQNFVEAWHFVREEAYFAATGVRLESIEIHDGGAFIFHDHARCATHLRGIEEAVEVIASRSTPCNSSVGDPAQPSSGEFDAGMPRSGDVAAAYQRFGEHARAYVDILLKHIENEEDFLYPVIERDVTPQRKQAAAEVFRRVSRETIDIQRLDECFVIVDRLAERFVASASRKR